jgi:hypothetical protein
MSESIAILKLQAQGFTEAMQMVAQLKAQIAELNGIYGGPGGTPTGSGAPTVASSSGGQVAAANALPPSPSTPPTTLSHAAANAGGPGAATIPANTPAHAGGAGGGAPPPGTDTNLTLRDLGAAIGGQMAYSQSMDILRQFAGGYSQSVVTGKPFHAESLIPGAGALAFTSIGAGIGFSLGGPPGALVGAGIGSGVGSIWQSTMEPIIKKDIAFDDMLSLMKSGYGMSDGRGVNGRIIRSSQGMTQGELDQQMAWLQSGVPLPAYAFHKSRELNSPFLRDAYDKSIHEALYSPGAIKKRGGRLPRLGDTWTDEEDDDMLLDTAYKNPVNAAILRRRGKTKLAGIAEKRAALAITLPDDMAGDEGAISYYGLTAGLAVRYGGSQAGRGEAEAEKSAMLSLAAHKRAQARLMSQSHNPGQAKALDFEADALLKTADLVDKERRFGAMGAEVSAHAESLMGSASRGMEKALFGGGRYDTLPWNELQRSYETSASELERLMRDKAAAGMLSPAERTQIENQVADLRHKASVGVPRQQEQARNRTILSEQTLKGAEMMAQGAHGFMFGSAQEQAGQYDAQLKVLQEREKVLKNILDTSRYITYEEKLQLQTEIQQLKVSEEQARKASALATAQAGRMERDTENVLGTFNPKKSLIRGVGGADASEAYSKLYSASLNDVSSAEKERTDLIKAGFDLKSPEVRAKDREIMSLKLTSEQTLRGMATVPESGKDRALRSNLDTQSAIYEAGFGGSPGALRGNLMQQMQLNQKRLQDLSSNRSKLISQGRWTEGMEGDYAESANAVRQSQVGLAARYDQGWQENLISEAYNMPSQGRLMMSQFTRREASLRGIVNPAFGGSEEDTRSMRMFPTRMMQMPGMGTPQGFNGHMLAAAASGKSKGNGEVTVRVIVETEKGVKLKDTTQTVEAFKSAEDVTTNVHARNTPSG